MLFYKDPVLYQKASLVNRII